MITVKRETINRDIAELSSRFNMLTVLGGGKFGTVYGCIDKTGRECAVKVSISKDYSSLQQFKREAQILKKLDHKNIVKYYESGNGYISTSLIHGRRLYDMPALSTRNITVLISKLSEALGYIHSKGIIHTDIKPENILVSNIGEVVLIDFGVSIPSGTQTKFRKGTATYTAPESKNSGLFLPQSDIYSLGVVWSELLKGNTPDNWQTEILDQMLLIDPQKRIKSGFELSELIKQKYRESEAVKAACLLG
jgi:serine/threonine protein kinase